ncbi:hypothetical protein EIJ12_21000 [Xanthomonas perforans]|uniref:hypothetical protein n=1 Tax=Xanthomonas TaxID=338 RepID=UPI00115EB0E7|nr:MULTISPECIES: hypothetical protein [Xanthomonas]MBZ3196341.1 hypothetical protein [Xanthomonas perforans]MBZ3213507.1 hypothetical protein [Xanthomonas perforans]MBZ3226392.1 hypothetical protein [Xanthomonas perforans]MBZ3287079.1 hypothetical protein [Xanthomonas perforans]MCC8628179.1 hypothetical protein [Xanthomonas vesicatoria]
MFYDDDKVRIAAERCARLESWLRVEQDPAEREKIAEALRDARDTLAKEVQRAEQERGTEPKGEPDADRMFPDGNVTDFLKRLDEAKAAGKAEADGDGAEVDASPDLASSASVDDRQPVLERVRELEPPKEITELPEYQHAYAEALERYQNEIAAQIEADQARNMEDMAEATLPAGEQVDDAGRTERAAYLYSPQDQVPELENGAEIEGSIAAIEDRDGQTYYIVKAEDGTRAAVPADPDLDLEAGDEIAVSRDRDGSYQVSHANDYGM